MIGGTGASFLRTGKCASIEVCCSFIVKCTMSMSYIVHNAAA